MAAGDIKFEASPFSLDSELDSLSGEKFVISKNLDSSRKIFITVEYPLGATANADGPLDFDHNYTVKIIEN